MVYFKLILIIAICIMFLLPQKASAGAAAQIVDKGINCTAKATYHITRYTLKGGWFIIRKTTKCAFAVTKGVVKGVNDAFSSPSVSKPVNKEDYKIHTLPPPPEI